MDWFLYDNGLRHERVKLRNVLFINFVCYFTEFKVRKYKFVFINNCLSTLTAILKEITFAIAPLLTVKVGRSPNLAIITVHFGLHHLLPLIFTFLFSESTQKLFFKFRLLRHDSWNIKKQRVLLIWNNRSEKKVSYNSRKIVKISN